MHDMFEDAEAAANPFLVDGAARTKEFVPQHADPSDDAGGPVPDEVWASEEFQDNLYQWSRVRRCSNDVTAAVHVLICFVFFFTCRVYSCAEA